jgi:hypothetical protein
MDRIEKALLGEGLASCDKCGHVEPMDRFVTIYLGERGEHIDLCQRCLNGDDGRGRVHINSPGRWPSR